MTADTSTTTITTPAASTTPVPATAAPTASAAGTTTSAPASLAVAVSSPVAEASASPVVVSSARAVGPVLAMAVRAVLVGVWRLTWWCWRHKHQTAALAVAGVVAWVVGGTRLLTLVLLALVVPAGVGAWWREVDPVGFERWCAGPWRRARLSWWWRRSWPGMSQVLDLGREHTTTAKDSDQVTVWRPARARVKTTSTTLHVRVRVPAGKTAAHVLAQAEAVAAMAGASSVRVEKASPSVAVWHLCMVRVLDTPPPLHTPDQRTRPRRPRAA